MAILLFILITLGAGLPAQAFPHDNVFWQFANWTAREHTNESCYVCHILPTSSSTNLLKPSHNNDSTTLTAISRGCISNRCISASLNPSTFTTNFMTTNLTHQEYLSRQGDRWCQASSGTGSASRTRCLKILRDTYKDAKPEGFKSFSPPGFMFKYCFKGTGNVFLGHIATSHCQTIYKPYTFNGSCPSGNCSAIAPSNGGTVVYDLDWYWVCGENVYLFLPAFWEGICALTQFNSSVILVTTNPTGTQHHHRSKRSTTDDSFPPPEHQLESKWNKFWQSLVPQYGLTQVWNQLEVTHYRLATYVNVTNAAMEGVRTELTALRLTTVQNRMALDILLAKEGGVCAMVGDMCCTYVPANDEEHGIIATKVEKMREVARELKLDEYGGSDWG
ncbi:uncharacterized protein LOC132874656 [Neoarius graeffei]|uniref:uncharacterized protein LOC132874656 n=1 Tax=Neoarius graeffei TaxID=443677 RepID=UPI00298D148D|nr:uncharacterized protein LOC132874656 [Neoarius graeffei]XP_060766990.1 uncharacterized protein LOC132874656 [Neoarius graeffei]